MFIDIIICSNAYDVNYSFSLILWVAFCFPIVFSSGVVFFPAVVFSATFQLRMSQRNDKCK